MTGIYQFKNKLENYIEPVINHPNLRIVKKAIVEIVKIIAAKIFLEFICRRFLINLSSKGSNIEIYSSVITAPLFEEIAFRGILLPSIQVVQDLLIQSEYDLTDKELKNQQVYRIHLAAFIFAAAHLLNPHEHIAGALVQFSWTYMGGLTYGYMSEKYQTISISILVHGINNSLAVGGSLMAIEGKIYQSCICIIALLANRAVAYVWAVTSVDQVITSKAFQMTGFLYSPINSSLSELDLE